MNVIARDTCLITASSVDWEPVGEESAETEHQWAHLISHVYLPFIPSNSLHPFFISFTLFSEEEGNGARGEGTGWGLTNEVPSVSSPEVFLERRFWLWMSSSVSSVTFL